MKVYAIEKDIGSLLLMDGLEVVNGAYKLKYCEDGITMYYGRKFTAYYAMEAPKGNSVDKFNKWDYNTVLNEAERQLKQKYPGGKIT